jgi:adenylylsulfate kinase-like enzyme
VTSAQPLDWDYTALADAYLARPGYAAAAIDHIIEITGLTRGGRVLDNGAGAGHLTIPLARRGCSVIALEPNPAMRAHGIRRTRELAEVQWIDTRMENTGQPSGSIAVCAYGSSFGVVDRMQTLGEAARVLEDRGWFVSIFNHRVLDDPLQREIEAFIKSCIPRFSYGDRRDDPSELIATTGFFEPARVVSVPITHAMPVEQWVEAWRSHATLRRQAGDGFPEIVSGIAAIASRSGSAVIDVPYITRACLARRLPRSAGTIWITGLSASGKSSLARALADRLRATAGIDAAVFDGDEFRAGLDRPYGHELADRHAVLRLLVGAVRQTNLEDRPAIVAALSHKREMRAHARQQLPRFMEVFLDCPADVCAARDTKDLYRRANAGEYRCFPGVTEPYERSNGVELVLDTAVLSVEAALERLLPRAIAFLTVPGESIQVSRDA